MRAAVFHGAGDVRLTDVADPIPLEDIIPRGFVPLTERRGEHIKILVRP